jgi:dimeric dUTPase (all-alpha-NTP-PPase superfamily)
MPTSSTDISQMLEKQLQLQKKSFGLDPRNLDADKLMEYICMNVLSLEDELHEAMKECGWKPWATDKYMNRDAFLKELVDAWHFFMNILLAISPGKTTTEISEEFATRYYEKNRINAERQRAGYTGVDGRCGFCGKNLALLGVSLHSEVHDMDFCDRTCLGEYGRKVKHGE